MFIIAWDTHEDKAVSVADVDQLLDRLHELFLNARPTLVMVQRVSNGDALSIGLGSQLSVLNYISGSGLPPYYQSVGESDSEDGISFLFGNTYSEFPLRAAVSMEVARDAIRYFCDTGNLSSALRWEQV
jgi:hypothetical protein